MCQPCRAELCSGQYPMRNGCAWNHSSSRPEATSIPHHLRPLGYRVGLVGKGHVKPAEAFPFKKIPGFDPSCVREPTQAHNLTPTRNFIENGDKPFCLVIALVDPHIPWVMGDRSQYPPEKITLPPNLADTPRTREDYAAYLAEITYMDGQVGEILATLEASRKKNDTLVLFTSEQGSQFPGCKWTSWDTGLHTALIARWARSCRLRQTHGRHIIQYADVLPTLLDLANGNSSKDTIDGTSFVGVLRGKSDAHREFAYGIHNNLPEGPAYPIRTVTDGRYRYIRNLSPEEIYIEKHLMGSGRLNNPSWATWVKTSWENPQTYNLVKRFTHRPTEQLYDTSADNYELDNRASDPELAKIKARLSKELDHWMESQGDPGIAQDTTESLEAARKLYNTSMDQSSHHAPRGGLRVD